MKRMNLEDLTIETMVESELEKRNCDGLYSPSGRCERGCSRMGLFSCGHACAGCRPGMQHPGTSDFKIVSPDEYCEIVDRIETERKRSEEKRRAEIAAAKKAKRVEIKQVKKEEGLKKKQERIERRKQFTENFDEKVRDFIEAVFAAVRTSILCKLLSGISIGSIVFSIVSIVFFEVIKYEWMASAAKAEALAAIYLFQKLFMFEAIYVFVIVAFTIALIIVRVIRGGGKSDLELENQTAEDEIDDEFFL